MWMVFFDHNRNISRTEPLTDFAEALEQARGGPRGAHFTVSYFSPDGDHSKSFQALEGDVA